MYDLLVAVATKNEGDTAEDFYRRLGPFTVITVDDTDEPGDKTRFWAQKNPTHFMIPGRGTGIAQAYKKAMFWAASRVRPNGYVVQIDAGLSHLPEFIPMMQGYATRHNYDLLLGTRPLKTKKGFRPFISRTAALLTGFKDATCGMRLWRSKYVSSAFGRITATGNAFQLETLAYAKRAGLKTGTFDIPYIMTNSNFKLWMLAEALRIYYKELHTW